MKQGKICVVVPTKNEESTIADVIQSIREGVSRAGYTECCILIVDDSRDQTKKVALANGAYVVRGSGDGLGSAMYKGLKAALQLNPTILMTADGDGQSDARNEIPRFLEPIENGSADLVLGSRFLNKDLIHYDYRWVNRLGTRLLSGIMNRQTGLKLTDSHGGLRAMQPEVAASLEMIGTHTYVQETIIDASEKGFRIVEIPSVWMRRKVGTSKVVASIPNYIFYTLPILVLRAGEHVRALYWFGFFLVFLAVAIFGAIFVEEGFTLKLAHRTPAFIFIALLTLLGSLTFFFGFVLQLLQQIKRSTDRAALPLIVIAAPTLEPAALAAGAGATERETTLETGEHERQCSELQS